MNGTRVWAAAAALLLAATARGESWKFDMGPESSPVMKGSKQVTDKTVFAEGKNSAGWRRVKGGSTARMRSIRSSAPSTPGPKSPSRRTTC